MMRDNAELTGAARRGAAWRLARVADDRQREPRGPGAMLWRVRLNDLLGCTWRFRGVRIGVVQFHKSGRCCEGSEPELFVEVVRIARGEHHAP
jgi:hypothetical protein